MTAPSMTTIHPVATPPTATSGARPGDDTSELDELLAHDVRDLACQCEHVGGLACPHQARWRCMADLIAAKISLQARLGIEPGLGHIVEWAVVQACEGSTDVNGAGRDFAMASKRLPKVEEPLGVSTDGAGNAIRAPYGTPSSPRRQQDQEAWLADDRLWVEVKHHLLRPQHVSDPELLYFHDTRSSGGPNTPFEPLVDAYAKVFVNPDGTVLSATLIPHEELMNYVLTEKDRGGSWNYKVAFSSGRSLGVDITQEVVAVLQKPFDWGAPATCSCEMPSSK